MKNKFYLNIDSPCSEDFNSFTPTKEGNFCSTRTYLTKVKLPFFLKASLFKNVPIIL